MKGSGTWDFQYYTAGHPSHLMTTTVSATLGSACVFAYYVRTKRCHKALVCKTERTIHHINTPESSSLTEQTVTLTFWSSVNSELLCWDCASFCRCLANLGKGGENRRVRTQHRTLPLPPPPPPPESVPAERFTDCCSKGFLFHMYGRPYRKIKQTKHKSDMVSTYIRQERPHI